MVYHCTCSLNTVGPYPVHIMNPLWGFLSICDVLPVGMKQFALWSVHVIQLLESCGIQHFPIDHSLTRFTPSHLRSWRFCSSALTSGSRQCSIYLHNDLFLFWIYCSAINKVLQICCANENIYSEEENMLFSCPNLKMVVILFSKNGGKDVKQ